MMCLENVYKLYGVQVKVLFHGVLFLINLKQNLLCISLI